MRSARPDLILTGLRTRGPMVDRPQVVAIFLLNDSCRFGYSETQVRVVGEPISFNRLKGSEFIALVADALETWPVSTRARYPAMLGA
jgi:hypothetical protein